MDELRKFLFDGLPVRGQIVRLTDAWTQILARRAANTETGAYPLPVQTLLGQMTAAGVLLQSNIKFNGALVLQLHGDGPLKLAVAEVQPDLSVRSTANVQAGVPADADLSDLANLHGQGRCAITLDPQDRQPGQQPYQGVVPLVDDHGQPLADLAQALQHYMHKSEQLDTTLVLAANDQVAAGLLIQRLPRTGQNNLEGQALAQGQRADPEAQAAAEAEDYQRIATLTASLTAPELLTLSLDQVLHRLYWDEKLVQLQPDTGPLRPRFACRCSRERVGRMLVGLGTAEVESLLAERGDVEVGCEFCGQQYRFDAVDAALLFTGSGALPGPAGGLH